MPVPLQARQVRLRPPGRHRLLPAPLHKRTAGAGHRRPAFLVLAYLVDTEQGVGRSQEHEVVAGSAYRLRAKIGGSL